MDNETTNPNNLKYSKLFFLSVVFLFLFIFVFVICILRIRNVNHETSSSIVNSDNFEQLNLDSSNIGERHGNEYNCVGTCHCDNNEEDRRRSYNTITRSVSYIVTAVSSSIAIVLSSKLFEDECNVRMKDVCQHSEIRSTVSVCDEIFENVVESPFPEPWLDDAKIEGLSYDGRIFFCEGHCLKNFEKNMPSRVANEDFGCEQHTFTKEVRVWRDRSWKEIAPPTLEDIELYGGLTTFKNIWFYQEAELTFVAYLEKKCQKASAAMCKKRNKEYFQCREPIWGPEFDSNAKCTFKDSLAERVDSDDSVHNWGLETGAKESGFGV